MALVNSERVDVGTSLRVGPKVEDVSEDAIRHLYFSTTHERTFQGKELPDAGRTENMLDVHWIGQRPTKYLKHHLNEAPLFNRDSCHYTQEYVPLPLGDNRINAQLAASFKGVSQKSKLTGPSDAKLSGETKYSQDFRPHSAAQMRGCKQRSYKPKEAKRATTLSTGGPLLESKSASHEQFQTPELSLAKNERVPPPRGCLYVSLLESAGLSKTAYQEQYVNPGRSSSCPAAKKMKRRTRVKSRMAAPTTVSTAIAIASAAQLKCQLQLQPPEEVAAAAANSTSTLLQPSCPASVVAATATAMATPTATAARTAASAAAATLGAKSQAAKPQVAAPLPASQAASGAAAPAASTSVVFKVSRRPKSAAAASTSLCSHYGRTYEASSVSQGAASVPQKMVLWRPASACATSAAGGSVAGTSQRQRLSSGAAQNPDFSPDFGRTSSSSVGGRPKRCNSAPSVGRRSVVASSSTTTVARGPAAEAMDQSSKDDRSLLDLAAAAYSPAIIYPERANGRGSSNSTSSMAGAAATTTIEGRTRPTSASAMLLGGMQQQQQQQHRSHRFSGPLSTIMGSDISANSWSPSCTAVAIPHNGNSYSNSIVSQQDTPQANRRPQSAVHAQAVRAAPGSQRPATADRGGGRSYIGSRVAPSTSQASSVPDSWTTVSTLESEIWKARRACYLMPGQ
mmetsp:Transcript_94148/g.206200  ORF Transcript_94148/g.206200 Transcript_94148/m.206200 type:complete len:682 (-) Transcript_94148:51-2096(-)